MGSIFKEKRNIIGLMTRGSNRFVYTCTRCGSEFDSANELETHFEIHNRSMRSNNTTSNRMEVRESEFSTQATNPTQSQSHSSR